MKIRLCVVLLTFLGATGSFAKKNSNNGVVISEFMASNASILQDEDWDYPDWIEIWNNSDESVNLENWSLSDNKEEPGKWTFPSWTLAAGAHVVVFASDKDRTPSNGILHTNFKLSASGEFLALFDPNGTMTSGFDPYPEQREDISYGLLGEEYRFLAEPTPGATNDTKELLERPVPSHSRGLYEQSFDLALLSPNGATMYYTLDGSAPSATSSSIYSEPISIASTTILRCVAYSNGEYSETLTETYIFPEAVAMQSDDPPGYPADWGNFTAISGKAPGDYGVDQEISKSPTYESQWTASLSSLPTLSLVSDLDNFFSHSTDPEIGGIYIHTGAPLSSTQSGIGKGWERPVSMEFFTADGSESVQADAGVRLHGGHSRRPEKSPKHSFRITFRAEYGPGELDYPLLGDDAVDEINSFILRASFNNSWRHATNGQRNRAQHIRDLWTKDTQLDMDHKTSHGRFVHLYINGLYWGVYNISERLNDDFMASYFKGSKEDFDVIKDYVEPSEGNLEAWEHIWSEVTNSNITQAENYFRLLGKNADGSNNEAYPDYLQVNNLIDYMLINFYGGNADWDHHNWVAARNRNQNEDGFRFFCWDSERTLEGVNDNVTSEYNEKTPSGIFKNLLENDEFKHNVYDRIRMHFFDGGALTPQAAADRYAARAEEVELSMIAESARWGDYRRDAHSWSSPPYDLYTQEDWQVERDRLMDDYFPDRTEVVLGQLRNSGMYPDIDAPEFSHYEGDAGLGFELTMSGTGGVIYYTTDEKDPRQIGGDVSQSATMYSEPIGISTAETTVKARAFDGEQWSALTVGKFNEEEVLGVSTPNALEPKVTVFPNPATHEVSFQLHDIDTHTATISLHSLDGKVLSQRLVAPVSNSEKPYTFSISGMPAGMYLFKVKTGARVYTGRLIKR